MPTSPNVPTYTHGHTQHPLPLHSRTGHRVEKDLASRELRHKNRAPAEPSKAKQRPSGQNGSAGGPRQRACRAKGADRHSPPARTPAPGTLCDGLAALPTQGSPAAGPPLSGELPPSSSGGWRPPEEAPTPGSVILRGPYRVAAGDSLPRDPAPRAAGEGGQWQGRCRGEFFC